MHLNTINFKFGEAQEYWKLDELYLDLAELKGKSLSKREQEWLRGLLLGYSPQEIKRFTCGSDNSNALRPGLSRDLYPLIKKLILNRTGEEIKISGCQILIWLEKLGYKKAIMWTYKEESFVTPNL